MKNNITIIEEELSRAIQHTWGVPPIYKKRRPKGLPIESLGAPNGHICDRWGPQRLHCGAPFRYPKNTILKNKRKNKK